LSKVLRLAPWLVAVWAALPAIPAVAQGNIDAGKTPAQIFTDTCGACHRSARELRRASSSFLRSHYTTSSEEAGAMANYLAGVGSDPRSAAQPKQPPRQQPAETPATASRQPPRQAAEPRSEARSEQRTEPKSAAKGRPGATAQARQQQPVPAPTPVVEEHPPDPPPAPVTPPAPPLEPFEE
jgi:hypothetical protein